LILQATDEDAWIIQYIGAPLGGHSNERIRCRFRGCKKLGRPRRDTPKSLAAIRKLRNQGVGINKIARKLGFGVSVVQRIVSSGRASFEAKRAQVETV